MNLHGRDSSLNVMLIPNDPRTDIRDPLADRKRGLSRSLRGTSQPVPQFLGQDTCRDPESTRAQQMVSLSNRMKTP